MFIWPPVILPSRIVQHQVLNLCAIDVMLDGSVQIHVGLKTRTKTRTKDSVSLLLYGRNGAAGSGTLGDVETLLGAWSIAASVWVR